MARAEGPHGFERTVVLKLLLQQFRRDAPMEKMFAREAAAYARLSHPAIVKLYDFFSAEGQLVMVLEFIDGLPLNRFRAMLRKNGEQVDDRASIFIASRVFASLAAAHGARDPESGEFAPVIHRDVNPSNILIPWDGHVKLADFGIAKVAGVSSDTQAGFIKGTYGYMAPEQVRGEPVTIRTDVYAASLLLWELLARRKAIQRGALPELEVLRAMAEPSLPSLDVLRPDLPQRLREAIARGLEPSPDARSITAEEMLIVLRESVTSNEGRNVLAETLIRVRQESDAARSGPPPAASADSTAKVAAQPEPPRPPQPRPPSEASIDGRMRTALGTGQVAAVAAPVTGAILARVTPVPPSFATKGAVPPQRQVATLALGLLREDVAGSYSAVATPGRPISEERAARIGVVVPPPSQRPPPAPPLGDSFPPALGGGVPATGGLPLQAGDSLPPVLGGVPQSAPIPPPPAALLAVAQEFESNPSTVPTPFSLPSRSAPPPAYAPPAPRAPPQAPQSQPPYAQPIAAMLAATLPMQPPAMPTPMPVGPIMPAPPPPGAILSPLPLASRGKGGAYVVIAGVALLGSALVIGALLYSRTNRGESAAATATATARATATAAATATPATATVATVAAPATATAPAVTAASKPAVATATPSPPLPTSPPPAAHASSSTEGDIVTPPKAGGHRVFVDGRYAGDSPGPIRVHCGQHTVKVGSGGVAKPVNVPCGGEISVSPK